MAFLQSAANRQSGGYNVSNSLKLENDNAEGLTRNYNGDGNRRTWTFSGWVKRSELGVDQHIIGAAYSNIRFMSNDLLRVELYDGSNTRYADLNRVFRDTSAWYHIVVALDSTQSTAANRVKIYINGVQNTSFNNSTYTNMSQNDEFGFGQASSNWQVGYNFAGGSNFKGFCGYIAEFKYTDGVANNASAFGELDEGSGIWKPKGYSGSYGNKGINLEFKNASDLGFSSATGSFALSNITAADQATDSPTNSFCTLVSPQQFVPSKTASLVKEGGTTMFGGNVQGAYSSMGIRSGKWYFESTITNSGGVNTENHGFGCIAANRLYEMNIAGEDIGADVGGWSCAGNANPRNNNSGASGANTISSPAVDVVLGCAIDMDNGKIWWHNAGTWHSLNSTVGNPANGTSPAWSNLLTATDDFVLPAGGLYQTGAAIRVMNFGGYALPVFTAVGTYSDANGHGSFSYAPPSGYYALCTKNLAKYGG